MPELAEVEFSRQQWNPGLGQKIISIHLHSQKRIFRGTSTALLARTIQGRHLRSSHAHGKQMLFRFGSDAWLGLHLGMTGRLSTATTSHSPRSHEHLVSAHRPPLSYFSGSPPLRPSPLSTSPRNPLLGGPTSPLQSTLLNSVSKNFKRSAPAAPGPRSKPSSSCNNFSPASATGWLTKFFGKPSSRHEPRLDSSLKNQFPISMPPFEKSAAMPSAPSARANPTPPDPGFSATAGKLDDIAPAATTRFSVPPSAVALPAGAPSANPPLPFLAQLPADRISICSGQDPLAVFNPPSAQTCPPNPARTPTAIPSPNSPPMA